MITEYGHYIGNGITETGEYSFNSVSEYGEYAPSKYIPVLSCEAGIVAGAQFGLSSVHTETFTAGAVCGSIAYAPSPFAEQYMLVMDGGGVGAATATFNIGRLLQSTAGSVADGILCLPVIGGCEAVVGGAVGVTSLMSFDFSAGCVSDAKVNYLMICDSMLSKTSSNKEFIMSDTTSKFVMVEV